MSAGEDELDATLRDPRSGGERFGEYHVVERLGFGGMGTVDLAVHAPLAGVQRPVALKRLHAHLCEDEEFVQLFRAEIRLALRITHPHACRLIEAGCRDGVWYYTMDLLHGASVADVIAHVVASVDPTLRGQWPAVLGRTIVDAAEALHSAHELCGPDGLSLGVVHRDVSPDNLFLGFDGAVRVIDFGIASARDRTFATRSGQLRGKAAYLAPERLFERTTDRRSDLWALAVIAWEGLAGRSLFRRPHVAQTIDAIHAHLVPPLSELGVPLEVEEVIAAGLSPDPARRPPTSRAFGRELARALRDVGWGAERADVSEWMERLLPDASRRSRRLAERATAQFREA